MMIIELVRTNIGTSLAAMIMILTMQYGYAYAQEGGEDRVDFGGYGSFRMDADDAQDGKTSFTMRRFVITTDARVGDRFTIYSEIEYERLTEIEVERSATKTEGGLEFEQELEGSNGSEIALEQAWGQYRITDGLGVRFGAVLPPVGRFNLSHDDNLWNVPRRPLIDRAAMVLPAQAAWTEMGLGFVGTSYLGERASISYEAYLLTGTSLGFAIEEKVQTRDPKRDKLELEVAVSPTQGPFDGSESADAFAGRIKLSPSLGSEIAISAYSGNYTPEYLESSERLTTLGIDGKQRIGSFQLEGEFLYSTYAGVSTVLDDFAATALESSTETTSDETGSLENEIEIEIGGLAEKRYGFWFDVSRVIPLAEGTLGLSDASLIPIVRYEHVWLIDNIDAFAFSRGDVTELVQSDVEQNRLSIGLAFRPVPQGVFHLTYSRSDARKGQLIDPVTSNGSTVNMLSFGLAVGF